MPRIDAPLSYCDHDLAQLEALALSIAGKTSPFTPDVCTGCTCTVPVVNGVRNLMACAMFREIIPF